MNSKDFISLSEVLRKLPLGEKKYIGIYGLGAHTRRLIKAWQQEMGPVQANLIFVDSNKQTLSEKYGEYDIYNVRDIRELPLSGIILSSFLYEEEMYKLLLQLYGNRFTIYRFYEWGKDEIFDAGGMYTKPQTKTQTVIKVNFVDFWSGFDPVRNLFGAALFPEYQLEISETPDILFCSHFGQNYKNHRRCIKIFLETEVMPFSFEDYDYIIGYRYVEDPKYFHYSIYSPRSVNEFQDRSTFKDPMLAKRKFCNFVYSNESWGEGAVLRREFCMALEQYRHIDCPGKVLNNMKDVVLPRKTQGWELSKMEFIKQYKFTIAFENHRVDGYTTEKLWDPFKAGSIPIYWGNPLIGREVSSEAFINCNEYDNNLDAVIERVREIDRDDEYYMYMLGKSPLKASFQSGFQGLKSYLGQMIRENGLESEN